MPLNNKHPVFNFALTWESIYLNLDLDAYPAAVPTRSISGYLLTFACGSRGTFGARLPA